MLGFYISFCGRSLLFTEVQNVRYLNALTNMLSLKLLAAVTRLLGFVFTQNALSYIGHHHLFSSLQLTSFEIKI